MQNLTIDKIKLIIQTKLKNLRANENMIVVESQDNSIVQIQSIENIRDVQNLQNVQPSVSETIESSS